MDQDRTGSLKTLEFSVTGRVQGVFFRASCKDAADDLGVTGWVRNNPDGRVEGSATGRPEDLEAFQAWLRQGPKLAKVEKLDVEEVETRKFTRFEVR